MIARLTRRGARRAETLLHPLSRVPTPALDQAMNAERITFIIDTNILIEFKPPSELPWRQICPNAKKVEIIIPSTVVQEIDGHKKLSGKLKKRAHQFAETARALARDGVSNSEGLNDVSVKITLGPLFRNSQLDDDLFALDDNDQRIAAEAAKIVESQPSAILLTDDINPMRLFKDAGYLVKMPPRDAKVWLRGDPYKDD